MIRCLLLLIFTGSLSLAARESKTPLTPNGLFRDHMVLQQESDATIWGICEPEETVSITGSWNRKTVRIKADANGKWKGLLQTPKAGGPYTVNITSAQENLTLKDVLIGEVWICSGQSNMQWRMRGFGLDHWADEVAKADYPQIRYCLVPQLMGLETQDNLKCNWTSCDPKSVLGFSAVAYFFGSSLHQELKVPIGLISTNWGGSTAEAWINPDVLGKKFPEFKSTLAKNSALKTKIGPVFPKSKTLPKGVNQMAPSLLYNSMIHPLIPFTIRGAIWYQGESNVKEPQQYRTLFPALIQNWRSEWGQGDFPFYFVQIAPFAYKREPYSAALLREAQAMALSEPNTGMVVTMDIGDPTNIHPKNKKPVGERLALLALAKNYGRKELPYSGPLLNEHKNSGSKIHLTFNHAESGLTTSDGQELTHFTISGEDQQFHPATATIQGQQIIVESPQVQKPVAVRFAWGSGDQPNFMNKGGLPASSFRTDTWPLKKR